MIGGKDQTGKYKMDARFNKSDLVERIEHIADYAERIKLTNLDAVKLIMGLKPNNVPTLCYLDPPYYVKGRDLYLNFYNEEDHRLIAHTVGAYSGLWLISYDAVPFVKDLYKEYRHSEYYLSYSAGNPSKGREIMFFSDNLVVPDADIIMK